MQQMYVMATLDDNKNVIQKRYAYGDPWVQQALFMDDIGFETELEAIAWWQEHYGQMKENGNV